MNGVAIQLDPERGTTARRVAQPGELVAEGRTVGRVDEDVILDEVALDLIGRAKRHDLAFVNDADPVGLLGLFQVMRPEEDRRAAAAADLREEAAESRAPRHVAPRRR